MTNIRMSKMLYFLIDFYISNILYYTISFCNISFDSISIYHKWPLNLKFNLKYKLLFLIG